MDDLALKLVELLAGTAVLILGLVLITDMRGTTSRLARLGLKATLLRRDSPLRDRTLKMQVQSVRFLGGMAVIVGAATVVGAIMR